MLANNSFSALSYLKKYKSKSAWNIVFNILTTFFSIISFIVLKPFLDILFLDNTASSSHSGSTTDGFLYYFTEFLNNHISQYGRYSGLVLVAILIIISFFFKNLCSIALNSSGTSIIGAWPHLSTKCNSQQ